jgi:hypothetical protein
MADVETGKWTLPDGSIYEGERVNGEFHGKGKLIFANGNVYEGDFVNGYRTGKGKYTWANGDKYEGDLVNNNQHGKGIYAYISGDKYEGDWIDGKQNGKGKYTWANGDKYEGDWVDGKPYGKGKRTWADGAVYEGDWVNEKRNGKGKMTYPDGEVEEGNWEDGKFVETEEQKKKAHYDNLVTIKNDAPSEDQYKYLAQEFLDMGNYENAVQLATECNNQMNILKERREEQERKEKLKKRIGLLLQFIVILAYLCRFFIKQMYMTMFDNIFTEIILIPFIISFALGFISLIFRKHINASSKKIPWGGAFLILAYVVIIVSIILIIAKGMIPVHGILDKASLKVIAGSPGGSIIQTLIPAIVFTYFLRLGIVDYWGIFEYIVFIVIFVIAGVVLNIILYFVSGNGFMIYFVLFIIPAFPGMIMISKVENDY